MIRRAARGLARTLAAIFIVAAGAVAIGAVMQATGLNRGDYTILAALMIGFMLLILGYDINSKHKS